MIDAQGQPLAGVAIEMEFKGESRAKIVKTLQTDKKGGFVRVGLKPGDWMLTFRKDGFKTVGLNTYLSMGGLGEIQPVTLEVAAPDPAAQQAAASAAPPPTRPRPLPRAPPTPSASARPTRTR